MTVCPNMLFGRNGRIWTCDHYTPSVVRYQTALRPEWLLFYPNFFRLQELIVTALYHLLIALITAIALLKTL